MGRLSIVMLRTLQASLVGALAMLATSGCDDDTKKGALPRSAGRSQSVVGPATAQAPSAPPTVGATHDAPKKRTGPLCAPVKPGLPALKASGFPAVPPGSAPGSLVRSEGWTWVNVWAAWCGPCKEEIPRLRRWEKELQKSGAAFHVAFISFDDDKRQLEKFLAAQPENGLRQTIWAGPEAARGPVMAAFGLDAESPLPVHALVDPKGKARCVVEGAVDDDDFDAVKKLVTQSP